MDRLDSQTKPQKLLCRCEAQCPGGRTSLRVSLHDLVPVVLPRGKPRLPRMELGRRAESRVSRFLALRQASAYPLTGAWRTPGTFSAKVGESALLEAQQFSGSGPALPVAVRAKQLWTFSAIRQVQQHRWCFCLWRSASPAVLNSVQRAQISQP